MVLREKKEMEFRMAMRKARSFQASLATKNPIDLSTSSNSSSTSSTGVSGSAPPVIVSSASSSVVKKRKLTYAASSSSASSSSSSSLSVGVKEVQVKPEGDWINVETDIALPPLAQIYMQQCHAAYLRLSVFKGHGTAPDVSIMSTDVETLGGIFHFTSTHDSAMLIEKVSSQ
jgi:hypothetical protein